MRDSNSVFFICVDGIFLTEKYKGQLLTTIDMDGNHQILPLVFTFVDTENTDSWYWFLEHVNAQAIGTRPDVNLIHDRHSGILSFIHQLQ
jgi:hypothetical protein